MTVEVINHVMIVNTQNDDTAMCYILGEHPQRIAHILKCATHMSIAWLYLVLSNQGVVPP